MTNDREKYSLSPVNLENPTNAHDFLILLTGKNKQVLELGPASGYLSKILKENGCNITGIEYDSELATQASKFLDKTIIGDIENLDLEKELSSSKFDVILIGDFLEHLSNPEKILKTLVTYLKKDGYFVISIPNISHGSIRLKLLDGDFDYKKTGLLDETHKRFFTLKTILKMLDNSGLRINQLHRVNVDIFGGSDGPDLKDFIIPSELIQAILRDPESTTFQYVFSAIPNSSSKNNWIYDFQKNYTITDLTNRINALHHQTLLEVKKDSEIKKLNETIDDLQKSIEEYQKIITDIHQSFVLRMLHKYDKSIGKFLPFRPKKYAPSTSNHQKISEIENIVNEIKLEKPTKKDIICFPIINWDFRFQRPQHIMTKFAEHDHRVFYLNASLRELGNPYEINKLSKNIYQIEINSSRFFDLYKDIFDEKTIEKFFESFEKFKNDINLDPVLFVQFPTWGPLCKQLQKKHNYKIIFDCLDDFSSFSNVINEREKEELSLIKASDLVLTTSEFLKKKISKNTNHQLFLPNAGEYVHFNRSNGGILKYSNPIIGYFGSISDWFDTELIEYLVSNRPDFTFVMIGHTFGADIRKLRKYSNIHFLGERPYSELPKYLHDFDVCLIPFKMNSLIEATHPVKIYEYFAAGKPVVASNMPELKMMYEMCYLAQNKQDFLQKLDLAVNENDETLRQKRIEFASKNTWKDRFETLYSELKKNDAFDIENHS